MHIYSDELDAAKSIHPLHVSRIITGKVRDDKHIIEIKKLGRGKVLAEFATAEAANDIIASQNLASHNLRIFIPTYKICRTGIIRDLSQGMDDATIIGVISSPFKIIEAKRLIRRIRMDGELQNSPSTSVLIKVASQMLSKSIFLYKVRHEVSLYIPRTKICYNCYRAGHIGPSCKSRARCLYCGEGRHSNDSEPCSRIHSIASCINCGGQHTAISSDCPIVVNHKIVTALAAAENPHFRS